MHLIVYISEFTGSTDEVSQVLSDITVVSKRNNPELEISGLLFYHDGHFLQVVEGDRFHLENLMSILQKDTRHENIVRLIDTSISERSYHDWNMDSFNLANGETLDPKQMKAIGDTYKRSFAMHSEHLVGFYKAMVGEDGFDKYFPNAT